MQQRNSLTAPPLPSRSPSPSPSPSPTPSPTPPPNPSSHPGHIPAHLMPPNTRIPTAQQIAQLKSLIAQNTSASLRTLEQKLLSPKSYIWLQEVYHKSHEDLLDFYILVALKKLFAQQPLEKKQRSLFIVWMIQIANDTDEFTTVEFTTMFASVAATFYRHQRGDNNCHDVLDALEFLATNAHKPCPRILILKTIVEIIDVLRRNRTTLEKRTIGSIFNQFMGIATGIFSTIVVSTNNFYTPYSLAYNEEYREGLVYQMTYYTLMVFRQCLEFDFFQYKRDVLDEQTPIQSEFLAIYSPICLPLKTFHRNHQLKTYTYFRNDSFINRIFFCFSEQKWPPIRIEIIKIIGGLFRLGPKFFIGGSKDLNPYYSKMNDYLIIIQKIVADNLNYEGFDDIAVITELGRTLLKSIVVNKFCIFNPICLRNVVINTSELLHYSFMGKKHIYISLFTPYIQFYNKLQQYHNFTDLMTQNSIHLSIRCFKNRFMNTVMDILDAHMKGEVAEIQEDSLATCVSEEVGEDWLLNEDLLDQYIAALKGTPLGLMEEEMENENVRIMFFYVKFEIEVERYRNVWEKEATKIMASQEIVGILLDVVERIAELNEEEEETEEDVLREKTVEKEKESEKPPQQPPLPTIREVVQKLQLKTIVQQNEEQHKSSPSLSQALSNSQSLLLSEESKQGIPISSPSNPIHPPPPVDDTQAVNTKNFHHLSLERPPPHSKPKFRPSPNQKPKPPQKDDSFFEDELLQYKIVFKYRLFLRYAMALALPTLATSQLSIPYSKIAYELIHLPSIDFPTISKLIILSSKHKQPTTRLKTEIINLMTSSPQNQEQYLQHLKLFTILSPFSEVLDILNENIETCLPKLIAVLDIMWETGYCYVLDEVVDWFFDDCYIAILDAISQIQGIHEAGLIADILEVFCLFFKINRRRPYTQQYNDFLLEEYDIVLRTTLKILLHHPITPQLLDTHFFPIMCSIEQLIHSSVEIFIIQNRFFSTSYIHPAYFSIDECIPYIIELIKPTLPHYTTPSSKQNLILYLENYFSRNRSFPRFFYDKNLQDILLHCIPHSLSFLTHLCSYPLFRRTEKKNMIIEVMNTTMGMEMLGYFEWYDVLKFYKENQEIVEEIAGEKENCRKYFEMVYDFDGVGLDQFVLMDRQLEKILLFRKNMKEGGNQDLYVWKEGTKDIDAPEEKKEEDEKKKEGKVGESVREEQEEEESSGFKRNRERERKAEEEEKRNQNERERARKEKERREREMKNREHQLEEMQRKQRKIRTEEKLRRYRIEEKQQEEEEQEEDKQERRSKEKKQEKKSRSIQKQKVELELKGKQNQEQKGSQNQQNAQNENENENKNKNQADQKEEQQQIHEQQGQKQQQEQEQEQEQDTHKEKDQDQDQDQDQEQDNDEDKDEDNNQDMEQNQDQNQNQDQDQDQNQNQNYQDQNKAQDEDQNSYKQPQDHQHPDESQEQKLLLTTRRKKRQIQQQQQYLEQYLEQSSNHKSITNKKKKKESNQNQDPEEGYRTP